MSVFIPLVTVWRWAPGDTYLYTPVHITEPTPSVLVPPRPSLSPAVSDCVRPICEALEEIRCHLSPTFPPHRDSTLLSCLIRLIFFFTFPPFTLLLWPHSSETEGKLMLGKPVYVFDRIFQVFKFFNCSLRSMSKKKSLKKVLDWGRNDLSPTVWRHFRA